MALGTGLLLANLTGRASESATSDTAPPPATIAHRDVPPVEGEPSEESAVDAAMNLATAPQQWLYLSDADLETRVREIAVPGSADHLVDDIVSEVAVARDALQHSAGRVWWLVRPLAWRVDEFDGGRATVSIWTVSVLSAADVALPQSDWFTSTFDLRWVGGRWQLSGSRDEPGPTPQLGGRDEPWQPEPFDETLAGFTRVGAEAAS